METMSRLEYCAEAEPRLLDLRDRISAESITKEAAFEELGTLVGHRRMDADWKAAQKRPCPRGRDARLFELEQFERAHPSGDLSLRLYPLGSSNHVFDQIAAELGLVTSQKRR